MKAIFPTPFTSVRCFKVLSTTAAALTLALGAQAQSTAPATGWAQSDPAATASQSGQSAAQGGQAATPASASQGAVRSGQASPAQSGQAQAKVRTVAVAPVDVPAALAQTLHSPAERESLRLFVDLVHKEIISNLNRSGTFQIVQRQDLSKILAEQDLGQSGNVNPQTAARIGELIGAQVLATVDLLQFDYMLRETHSAAINRNIVTVSLDTSANLTLLDTTTGALLASATGEGKAAETKQYFANSQQQGGFDRVPVTDAARQIVDNLVNALTTELFPTRVVAVTGKQATLNRGTGNFKNGDIVDIVQLGAELRDPDTGRSLGREEVLIGHGKVVRVTAQTTTITLTEDNGVQPGQVAIKQQ